MLPRSSRPTHRLHRMRPIHSAINRRASRFEKIVSRSHAPASPVGTEPVEIDRLVGAAFQPCEQIDIGRRQPATSARYRRVLVAERGAAAVFASRAEIPTASRR